MSETLVRHAPRPASTRIRTRKNPLNGTWDVQEQTHPGFPWRSIGRVRGVLPDFQTGVRYEATHFGHVLGLFDTKREAVTAIVGAES